MDKSKKRKLIILSIIAVAIIIAAAIAIPLILDSSNAQELNSSQQKDKKIVTGINGDMVDEAPPLGMVYINGSVIKAMEDSKNQDDLFYINVETYYDVNNLFIYKGKTMAQWREDPELTAFNESSEEWYDNIYLPLDEEMRAAEQSGEEHAQGWEKHDPDELYKKYWYDTHSEDEIEAYEKAFANLLEASTAYNEWINSDEYIAIDKDIRKEECARLVGLGYDLQAFDYMIAGYLTKEQIEDFPATNEFGYIIEWADKKNADMND